MNELFVTMFYIGFFALVGGSLAFVVITSEKKRAKKERLTELAIDVEPPPPEQIQRVLEDLFSEDIPDTLTTPYSSQMSSWARRLNGSAEDWTLFTLSLSGKTDFPDALPAESRLDWAMMHRTRGSVLATALTHVSNDQGHLDLAHEGLEHDESVEVAHAYIAQWHGTTMANYERDQRAEARAQNDTVEPDARLDGALEVSRASDSGGLSVASERGGLSRAHANDDGDPS